MQHHKITPAMVRVKRSSAGLGLFAASPIRRGSRIEYTGERITQDESNRRGGKYLFAVDEKLVIDGRKRENVARYINHSCEPNCESEIIGRRVYIIALRNIERGEELTYDYGEEYFDEHIKPYGCRCAAHGTKRA